MDKRFFLNEWWKSKIGHGVIEHGVIAHWKTRPFGPLHLCRSSDTYLHWSYFLFWSYSHHLLPDSTTHWRHYSLHVFGMWDESRTHGETHMVTGRTGKFHIDSIGALNRIKLLFSDLEAVVRCVAEIPHYLSLSSTKVAPNISLEIESPTTQIVVYIITSRWNHVWLDQLHTLARITCHTSFIYRTYWQKLQLIAPYYECHGRDSVDIVHHGDLLFLLNLDFLTFQPP